ASYALQPHRPHQPFDRAPRNLLALTLELLPDLARAIDPEVLLEDTGDLLAQLGVAPYPRRRPGRIDAARGMNMIGRWGDRRDPANRLEPPTLRGSFDEA